MRHYEKFTVENGTGIIVCEYFRNGQGKSSEHAVYFGFRFHNVFFICQCFRTAGRTDFYNRFPGRKQSAFGKICGIERAAA